MLIPLTRKAFNALIPPVATGAQYAHCWGKLQDVLRRVLISVVGIFGVILLKVLLLQHGVDEILLVIGLIIGLYWLWGPVLWASLQNRECRRYGFCGFWQGKVLDIYITEDLIGTQETVNSRGDLVIVENRERCLNLEVGDEAGFLTDLKVPLKRYHQAIDVGDIAELLVLSNRSDLGRIGKTSDIYIPDHNIWVSDYPYLQREAFIEVSRRVNVRIEAQREEKDTEPAKSKRNKRTPKTSPRSGSARRERLEPRDRYQEDYPEPDWEDRETQPSRRRSSRRR